MKKCFVLISAVLSVYISATAAADVRMAGNACHPEGNTDAYWYWYQSCIYNDSTSNIYYVRCPVAGVDLANYIAGTAYVIDNSYSYVVCSLATVDLNGTGSGYYSTRYSAGNSPTPTTLDFGSIPTLGRTPALNCQIPNKNGGNRSGIHSYTTYSY